MSDAPVEQATAAPGEKREVLRAVRKGPTAERPGYKYDCLLCGVRLRNIDAAILHEEWHRELDGATHELRIR